MVQKMPVVTEPAAAKMAETPPLESDPKQVQYLVNFLPSDSLDNSSSISPKWSKVVVYLCIWMIKRLMVRTKLQSNRSSMFSILVSAEIVSIRECKGVREFYIHYLNYNRRLDEWVKLDRMNLKELAPPSTSSASSSSSSSSNNISQEISQSRTVPAPTTTTTAASTSNDTSAGNTTTFFLSDDTESLNNELTQSAALSPLTDCSAPPSVVPTKIRGNGNNHHSGAHAVTKVKNIELIHLGRYFIKPWYFSPYPEVFLSSIISN